MKKICLALIICCILIGCQYGDESYVRATMIAHRDYPATDSTIEVYTGGELENRKYIQLAHLEAIGHKEATSYDLLVLLRKKARSIGADAVISVRQINKIKSDGRPLLDSTGRAIEEAPENTKYKAVVLKGVAIKYVD